MLKLEREKLLASTMITSVAAGLLFTGVAAAQAPTAAPADTAAAEDSEEVVVTGTRIRNANVVSTSPITQVSAADIKTQGVTRIEDLVTQLPQAFASQNSTVVNGASGTATISLRNLGSVRTLVLIDGRRMGYGSPLDTAADLNQIPGGFIERVDVLTGGASATYGSDAIAGVVNFITKKDFEGIEVDAQYGFYQHNNDYDGVGNIRDEIEIRSQTNPSQFKLPKDNVVDGYSREATVTMGVNSGDGKGNITAYFTYRNNDAVLQGERDYSACTIANPTAARPDNFACGGSGTSFPGQFTDFVNYAYTVDQTTGEFVDYNGAVNAYNFGPLNYYQRPDERYGFGANGHYEINEHFEVYGQLMFSDYESVAQIAPSGSFFNTADIGCDNPLLSAQQSAAIGCSAANIAAGDRVPLYIGRRNVEGGGRQDSLNYESYRAVGGVRGEIAEGWNYDVAGQFNRVRLSRVYNNDFSAARLARALDVVSVGGVPTCRSVVDGTDPSCVPYNVFAVGGVTQDALNYLQIPLIQVGTTTERVFTAEVSGDLGQYGIQTPWAQTGVSVNFGVEFRRNEIDTTTDAAFAAGDGTGQGGPTIGLSGSTDVTDLFAEADIPLIEGLPGAELLSVNAAYRYSDYDSGISTDTYKFGAEYSPVEDVRLRASYQKAVRAANVIELFAAQGFNLFDMDADPCGPAMTATLEQCVATGVPAARYGTAALDSPAGQYNFLQGGNPDLQPEESETQTYGIVLTPTFVDNLVISVDYFKIEVEDLITVINPPDILALCYEGGNAAACAQINRNPANGTLWVGDGHVESLNTNIGSLETSGIDINVNYSFEIDPEYGSLALSMQGTWLDELITDNGLVGQEPYDCAGLYGGSGCGTPNPTWRHRARATWTTPWDADLSVTWRYYSSVDLQDGDVERLDYQLDSQNYFDLAANIYLPQDTTMRLGVNNVFDRDPPLTVSAGTSGNGNTYPQLYDSLGRYMFVGLTTRF